MSRRHPPWETDSLKFIAGASNRSSASKLGLNVLSGGEEYDDYYAINCDHQRESAPWRIAEHTDAGALDDDQVADIARRFGFKTEDVRRLSICVGWALERLNPIRNFPARRIPVPWERKHPKGTPELLHYLRVSYDAQAEAVAWLRKACCEAERSDYCECWHCIERRTIEDLMDQARQQYRRVAPLLEAPKRLWDIEPIDILGVTEDPNFDVLTSDAAAIQVEA